MKKNFTQFISEVSKARQFTFAIATLLLIIISAAYLRAAVGITITGGSAVNVTADLAANATLSTPGFTALGDILIIEGNTTDISSSGNLILNAPAGWKFGTGADAVVEVLDGGYGSRGINVGTIATSSNGLQITIPIIYSGTNKLEQIRVTGVTVQALFGANLPATGNILVTTEGTTINGLPTSVPKEITQINGVTRSIAFGQQPTDALTETAISPAPTVILKDQFGNTVTNGAGNNATVNLTIANNPSSGTLGGTVSVAAVNGVATFGNININNAGNGYTLTAKSGSLTSAASSPFNITNKKPTITSLSKTCGSVGDAGFNLTITGTEYAQGAKVRITKPDNTTVDLDPTSLSKTQIVVGVDNTVFAVAGAYNIRIVNKAAGQSDVISDPVTYTVYANLAANAITGTLQLCAGTSATYTAPTGFTNYTWSVPGGTGTITTGQGTRTATISFDASTSGNITLTLNATNGCNKVSSASYVVDVKAKPVVNIIASDSEICTGASTTLTASGADSYVWSGDGVTAGTTGESIIVTPTETTTYTVIGTTNGCESAAKTITIVVNELPLLSIGDLNAAYCSSDAAVTLTGSPAGGTFRILENSAEVATGESFNPSSLGAGNYVIEYTYTDGKSCTNTTTKAVTVKQQPTVTVTNNLEICVGASATLTATGAGSYTWSPATGLSATTGSSVTANPTQTTTYTVVGTTDGCQSLAKTVTVTVNELPDASVIVRGPSVFCPENYVDLVAINNPDYTYQWYRLNSNNSSTALTASIEGPHVYSATTTGNYYVTITSDKGCIQSSEPIAVQVANVPNTATIGIVGPTTFCEGSSVRFSANQSPTTEPYSYQWQVSPTGNENDFTNIEGEEGKRSGYTATTTGFYRVQVSNTEESTEDVEKCTKTSVPVEVKALPQPTAQILGGNQSLCLEQDGITSFFLEGEFANGEYEWYSNKGGWVITDLGNSTPGKTSIRVDVAANNPAWSATITLRSRKTNSGCNLATSSVTLEFKQIPNTTITANRPISAENTITICRGESIVLTANPGTGNYLWSTGVTTRTITVTEPGSYTVTVTNSNGCAITSAPVTVIVNELPVVTIDTQLNAAYCKSAEAVTLTGSPANGKFRILRGTTVVNANATELNPAELAAGTYTIAYSFTNGNTCTNTATKTVTINALPTVAIVEPSKAAYCTSEPVFSLAGNQAGGSFTINGQSATTFNAASLGAGTHTIVYTYTDENGCTNTATKTVIVNPLPTASISYTGPTTVCQGGGVLLTGNSDTGYTFTWFRDGAQVATGATYTAAITGSYTVRATNINTCTSEMSAAVAVTVNPTITGNSIAGTQTVCSGATIAALGQASGTTLAGGATPYSYQWEQRIGTGGNWTLITGANSASYIPPVQTVTSQTITYYRRIVSGGGCSITSTQNVSVTINPKPGNNGFSLGTDSDSDGDGKFADVYSGQGIIPLKGNPGGGAFKIDGADATTLDPCTILGAANEKTVTITYTTTLGTCTTTVSKTVKVKRSVYTVVVVADPFPVCRGQNTDYTAFVYRDIERVIYPYMTNAAGQPLNAQGQVVADNEEPAPNPDFINNTAYVPANTPAIIKQYAYRYFEAKVIMGSGALVNGADGNDNKVNSFTYRWTRSKSDGSSIAEDARTRGFAGLSATDWVGVWVTPKNNGAICGYAMNTLSSRIYFSEPQGYSMTLNTVPTWCYNPNDQSNVTLTATLGNLVGGWEAANVTVKWYLERSGVTDVLLGTTAGVNGSPISISVPRSTFQNGDQVYLVFTSDIDTVTNSKCGADPETSQKITIRIDQPVAITANLSATPAQCEAGRVTLSVTATGSNLQYAWYKEGSTIPLANVSGNISGATTNVLTISNLALSDAGKYYVKVSNSTSSACSSTITSNTTELVVNPLTRITAQPQGLTLCSGQPASFSGAATGTNVTYQWYKGSTAIPGATSNTFSKALVTAADAGNYTLRVTGTCGVLTSSVATLIVNEPVTATPTLAATTQCQGNAVNMSVTATGTGLKFEWFKDNVSIGNNNNTLSIPNAQVANNGAYSVKVTGTCTPGGVTVNMGTLTIKPNIPAIGEIFATHKTDGRPITDADPVKLGETAVFTVENDFADNEEVVEYLWYVRPSGGGISQWNLAQRSTSNIYERVAENDDPYEVRVTINIIGSAVNECYTSNTIDVFFEGKITPLPVELIYFKAVRRDNAAVLTWATAMEKNNEGFEVQVSQDGVNYRQLQFVATKNGNTSIKQTYEFVDKENGKFGTRYYRLRQLDSNGEYAYYGPQMVIFGDVNNSVFVYPNPFEREVKLDVDSEKDATMEVTLTNLMGKKLMTKSIDVAKGRSSAALDLGEGLPAGIYIVTTRLNGITTNFKLMKK